MKGGDKLAKRMQDIAKRLGTDPSVYVGFKEGATYPDGKSVPLIAAFNEFGVPSRGQPPRPFMRNTIAKHGKDWPKAAAALLKANDFDAAKTLALVGKGIEGQVVQSIHDLVAPPLAASTIARKGFDKPLIHTSLMWKSVTSWTED